MTDMSTRNSFWLTLGTLGTTLFQIAGYHGAIRTGQFIARGQMAVVGAAVLIGAGTVAGTLTAVLKDPRNTAQPAVTYRGQMVVNSSTAAFILGMLVYLAFYPPTPWVFNTTLVLTFVFGIMLMIPVLNADAPGVVAVLNGCAGLSACAAGFAAGSGALVMAGALIAAAGWILAIALQRTMTRSLPGALFSAFSDGTRT
ncbi:MAG: NAD(P)(+) transhydrogenase (Re/Si-specific) subunit beta [Gemmatimonadaceae bacterium]